MLTISSGVRVKMFLVVAIWEALAAVLSVSVLKTKYKIQETERAMTVTIPTIKYNFLRDIVSGTSTSVNLCAFLAMPGTSAIVTQLVPS